MPDLQRGVRVDEAGRARRRRGVLTSGEAPIERSSGEPISGERVFSRTYIGLVLGIFSTVFLIAFEALAVATALPLAARDLNGFDLYAWSFSALLLASLVSTVAAGEYNDRHGPRTPLLGGAAVFVGGLLIAGAAQTMVEFVLGRAVQGVGVGFVIVSLYVVVSRAFPQHLRPRMVALMSSGWVLPSIIGPVIAGYIAENFSWRWVFLGIPPLVVPAIALMSGRLGSLTAPLDQAPGRGVRGWPRIALAAGAAVGVALLQYAGQHLGWFSLLFVAAGVTLLAFTLHKLLPHGAFVLRRGLPATIMMRGFIAAAFTGTEAFIPLMLITQRGLSATQAGASLTGAALGWASGSWLQGRPTTRTPRNRLVQLGAGLVAVSVSATALTVVDVTPAWTIAIAWAVCGLGMGLSMSSITVLTFEQSPVDEQGANAAALQISDVTMSVAFVALGGTLLAAGGGADAGPSTFLAIFVVMAVLAAFASSVAPRVRAPEGRPVALDARARP